MTSLINVDRPSLALLTDLYQLTMAYGYWRTGVADRESVFHLTFRENPFGGGFSVACGLSSALEAAAGFKFCADDLSYLSEIRGSDDRPIFDQEFMDALREFDLRCDMDGIPEGTIVLPQEPLLRVRGPLWQCQLLETLLLNLVNFQTLVATKAARICLAAEGDAVLEFGLRRAQGVDGGLTASRAAFIGGCDATSNVMAGKEFGIPVRGTHAHSWVLAFEDEQAAFDAYAGALPNNCVLLVDTFDTLRGVERAAEIGLRLREQGHSLVGVRLDSGDLRSLSRKAREILDSRGLKDALIVASNDLDEHEIKRLKAAGAKVNVWGVGTRLATAYDQPALGGVYKLSAIREAGRRQWTPRLKLSEQPIKVSNPGILQVRRYREQGRILGDVLFDESGMSAGLGVTAKLPPHLAGSDAHEDLLVPVLREGTPVYEPPKAAVARARTLQQLSDLPAAAKKLEDAVELEVSLDAGLAQLKERLITEARRSQP